MFRFETISPRMMDVNLCSAWYVKYTLTAAMNFVNEMSGNRIAKKCNMPDLSIRATGSPA